MDEKQTSIEEFKIESIYFDMATKLLNFMFFEKYQRINMYNFSYQKDILKIKHDHVDWLLEVFKNYGITLNKNKENIIEKYRTEVKTVLTPFLLKKLTQEQAQNKLDSPLNRFAEHDGSCDGLCSHSGGNFKVCWKESFSVPLDCSHLLREINIPKVLLLAERLGVISFKIEYNNVPYKNPFFTKHDIENTKFSYNITIWVNNLIDNIKTKLGCIYFTCYAPNENSADSILFNKFKHIWDKRMDYHRPPWFEYARLPQIVYALHIIHFVKFIVPSENLKLSYDPNIDLKVFLEEIDQKINSLTNELISVLPEKDLKTSNLMENTLGDNRLKTLEEAIKNNSLKDLNLTGIELDKMPKGLEILKNIIETHPNLEILNLSKSGFTDTMLEKILPILFKRQKIKTIIVDDNISDRLKNRLQSYLNVSAKNNTPTTTSQSITKSTPDIEISEDFICPITGEIMVDPVSLEETGQTYEREAIEKWLSQKNTDPLTNKVLTDKTIIPNLFAKKMISGFLDKNIEKHPGLAEKVYFSQSLSEKLIEYFKIKKPTADQIKEFENILSKDKSFLTKKLKDKKTLLELACSEASLELLNVVLNKLSEIIWELPSVYNDNGLSLFLTVTSRLGADGAKLMEKALGWSASEIQDLLFNLVKNNDPQIELITLCEKVDVNQSDEFGNTPLHYALSQGNKEIANVLIKCGAKVKLQNNEKKTPIELEKLAGNYGLAQWAKQEYQRQKIEPFLTPLKEQVEKQEKAFAFVRKHAGFFRTTPPEKAILTLQGHSGIISSIAVFPNGNAISTSWDHTLRIWDTSSGQFSKILQDNTHVYDVAVLPDGNVISACDDKTLKIWDIKSGKCLKTLQGHNHWVTGVAVLPNGNAISASSDNTLMVWDVSSGKCLMILKGHTNYANRVAVLSNGNAVSTSNDGTLKIWDPSSGQCLKTLQGHSGGVSSVAVLPNGNIISGSIDNTLKVWDINSGQCLRTLQGHTSYVLSVAAMPNGIAISGSTDTTLKVWDIDSGQCLMTLQGHTAQIRDVAILPNGNAISVSDDKTLKIWELPQLELRLRLPNQSVINESITKEFTECKMM